jgi:hypothetical protein
MNLDHDGQISSGSRRHAKIAKAGPARKALSRMASPNPSRIGKLHREYL